MKRSVRILILGLSIVMLLGIGSFFAFSHIEQRLLNLENLPVMHEIPRSLADGTYDGTYSTFPIKVRVQVHVVNKQMQAIELLEHRNGQGSAASAILDDVVAKQSLTVDTISGATYSSIVMLKAVEDALNKAGEV